ncbi:NAD(P)/FAD-dependent oxidoreductase [Desulfurivibrio alkaliphilus]|uniref:Amine oxidase n=1 Tax=Desulfurivibrio alkaliphilus (strain DSM 19089 / UNIQEM U267 / AHT2) TaxID=589865 RepID=D6Z047_DESAT|nr:NAD(P)/FAD-dependent oxidoreductase [Desulfurivibrio alkaliphilus]ADH87080.1 amine oxidase [Desulfurivibrio alkaliphilus AHT 2]
MSAPSPPKRRAIIIGAGPAGLTAALELLRQTDITPLILEASPHIGGISRTENYRGNRIDIGGHRFFSRSQKIMEWWQEIMPPQGAPARDDRALGRDLADLLTAGGPDPEQTDLVMLQRFRLSRILHRRRFLDYPLAVGLPLVRALGVGRLLLILLSYLRAHLFPIREEQNLEDFFINRFGYRLYATFFKDYTEKVWGRPCREIPAEWGAQRVKGLSVAGAVKHALRFLLTSPRVRHRQKVETSLIHHFLYPKLGPGQLWEEVAKRVTEQGGELLTGRQVVGISTSGKRVTGVRVRNLADGTEYTEEAEFCFSTMPVRDLIAALDQTPPKIRELGRGLVYRDFLTIGLLLSRMSGTPAGKQNSQNHRAATDKLLPDNWIYIQEHDVRLGRLQIFNNWSPYLVHDSNTVWVGLEYFCNEGDDLWSMADRQLQQLGVEEMSRLGFITPADVLDGVVIRQPKAYPAYFGTYHQFHEIRDFTDRLENLFLIGRNGMHRYNNMDHSMLAAMAAVTAAKNGDTDKQAIWEVNSEEEYHEQ